MAEVTIPKEKMDYTIDLLITMVTEEISEETGKDRKEILTDFLCSKTGKALYDIVQGRIKEILIWDVSLNLDDNMVIKNFYFEEVTNKPILFTAQP